MFFKDEPAVNICVKKWLQNNSKQLMVQVLFEYGRNSECDV